VPSGEFFGELFGQGVSRRICDLIDVLLHLLPGFGLGFVFAISQLLDLLDMMASMREQETLQRIFW
jgi:hypothetical protein